MKIMIVDDHEVVRAGLRSMLESAGLPVAGCATNGRDALARAHELRPDVVLMDIAMPELNGIDATRQLLAAFPRTKVIAFSTKSDRASVCAMFAAGASAYLTKGATSAADLIKAVNAVVSGQRYRGPVVADLEIDPAVERPDVQIGRRYSVRAAGFGRAISRREREVLQLLAEGNSSKEIAAVLGLALPTIETHRRQIMSKLGLHSIAELTKYAVREGLTSLD